MWVRVWSKKHKRAMSKLRLHQYKTLLISDSDAKAILINFENCQFHSNENGEEISSGTKH